MKMSFRIVDPKNPNDLDYTNRWDDLISALDKLDFNSIGGWRCQYENRG